MSSVYARSPVCDWHRLLGMVTDRDIAVRAVAEGLDGTRSCVSDIMTDDMASCSSEQDVQDLKCVMGERKVPWLPVVDAEANLIGIVSLADLATRQLGHTAT